MQFTLSSDRARIPDVAWMSQAKLDLIPRENRAIPIAPDIAVQMISESEQPEKVKKLRDYLEGIRLESNQVLTSERLPGLSLPVPDMFNVQIKPQRRHA
jgi:hypothetical protein